MVDITNSELIVISKPFLALQEMMQDVPENANIKGQVHICLKILESKKTPEVMGAAATKGIFGMFKLTDRIWLPNVSLRRRRKDYLTYMAYLPKNQLWIRESKVSAIIVQQKELEELKKVLNSNRFTRSRKETVQKRITGCCCVCGSIPTMQVSYNADGATRIEKYCDNCIKSVYSREAVL